jgi:CheY-like chemotaxis protein
MSDSCEMPAAAHHGQETILVVDGDVITRTVISDYLRHCGYRVIEAHDAEEARQALAQEGFNVDVILCDIELPGDLNGFQLASWVRQNMAAVKVVLSSAVARTAEAAGELCEQGPHLAKPYEPLMVVDHIKRLRGGAASRSE